MLLYWKLCSFVSVVILPDRLNMFGHSSPDALLNPGYCITCCPLNEGTIFLYFAIFLYINVHVVFNRLLFVPFILIIIITINWIVGVANLIRGINSIGSGWQSRKMKISGHPTDPTFKRPTKQKLFLKYKLILIIVIKAIIRHKLIITKFTIVFCPQYIEIMFTFILHAFKLLIHKKKSFPFVETTAIPATKKTPQSSNHKAALGSISLYLPVVWYGQT